MVLAVGWAPAEAVKFLAEAERDFAHALVAGVVALRRSAWANALACCASNDRLVRRVCPPCARAGKFTVHRPRRARPRRRSARTGWRAPRRCGCRPGSD